jgi:hypothetical protein
VHGVLLALVACGCSFCAGTPVPATGDAPTAADDAAAADSIGADASVDAIMAAPPCPADLDLQVCLSFDAATLANPLPNEGAAPLDIPWTDLVRIATTDGGAAQTGATSELRVPASETRVLALEIWFRIDTEPAANARVGIADANATPGVDLFYYRGNGSARQLRCYINGNYLYADVSALTAGWVYVVCACEAGSTRLYLDGVELASSQGCDVGLLDVAGLTIGQNNNGPNAPVDDWLIGAIDLVRLWSKELSATTICEHAGRPDCS